MDTLQAPVTAEITMPDKDSLEFVLACSYNEMCSKKFSLIAAFPRGVPIPEIPYKIERNKAKTIIKVADVVFETSSAKITMPDRDSMDHLLICAHNVLCAVKNRLYCARVQSKKQPLFIEVPFQSKIINE